MSRQLNLACDQTRQTHLDGCPPTTARQAALNRAREKFAQLRREEEEGGSTA